MRAGFISLLALNAAGVLAAPQATTIGSSAPEAININELADLAAAAYETAQGLAGDKTKRANTCNWSNVRVRREWGSLSKKEKKSYIDAVKCLQSKPSKSPASFAAGAKTRFDDWVAVHLNQTQTIHYTGNFLTWHRYFTWLYEEALRNECGYKGTQPYWDWALTALSGLNKSPVFDGSDLSLSGDGEFIPNQPDIVLGASSGLPPIYLPAGSGGGCVKSGPFKDMKVNLGPAALDLPGGGVAANPNPLDYNPRCLKRDLSDAVNRRFANATSILNNILKPKTVLDFQMQMQGVPGTGDIGIHGGGHYSLGGDPGRDVFTSPGDPAFYLHHSMIDRVWWIWQMLDPKERVSGKNAVQGTNTFLDMPPSAETTLDDYVNIGWVGPERQIKDLMSTLSGPFCYVYL
ncbi:monophenol monooxygenase (tyrosinase) [Fusarium beomiforme]|uniref:Monophenol monooxygenase (Tyrosinase) n=1 Tax=Fusarium beomiforme TaxID=44412 RepID=A0A9P5E2M0_9HYPO|nr:monophenol monooxygenase (tyrosinase) [Fusarium beomiforme]